MATAPLDIYETTLGQVLYETHPDEAIAARGECMQLLGARDIFEHSLVREWDALACDASEPNPFAESWYVAAGARAFDPHGQQRYAAYFADNRLRGVIPLTISNGYGRIAVRHVENWQHPNAFLGTPLIETGHELRFWLFLLVHLDRAEWAQGFFHIRGLTEGGAVHRALREAADKFGRPCEVVLSENRPMRMSAEPRDLAKILDSKRRSEFRRKRRRLEDAGKVVVREFGPGDDFGSWSEALLSLEAAGWKGRAGSALASDQATNGFAREVLFEAHRRERLHGLSMELDGKPIAMLSNIVGTPGAFGFKAAFDEEYARFSPGQLLQLEALERAIPGGAAWHDSCASDKHPVSAFWSEAREIVRVTVPLAGFSRRLTHAGVRTLERLAAQRRALRKNLK